MIEEPSLQWFIPMFDFAHKEVASNKTSLGSKFGDGAKHYVITVTHKVSGKKLKTPFSMGPSIAEVFNQPDPMFILSCLQMEACLGYHSYKEAMEMFHENFEGVMDSKELYKHWVNISKWFFMALGEDFESFCEAEVTIH